MPIRSNALGHYGDLSPELQQTLRRNGMQAHLIMNGDAVQLAVQGHDSPLLTYNLTRQQLSALTDGGTNYSNQKAYDTMASIVANDFHMPKDFVHARNANGRVVMGLHGYRIGTGEYGRPLNPMLGWTPRQAPGWHMRRVGGALFIQGAPMVPERPDGRMKPGELQSGGYGFYWKGPQTATQARVASEDVLQQLKEVNPVIQARARQNEPAKPYNEVITSDVYFSKDKWQEVLASHGVIIDESMKTLTVQSSSINKDLVYDLRDDEISKLLDPSIKDTPVSNRLEIINDIIKADYQDTVTMETLNSKQQISIALRPEVIQEIQSLSRNESQMETMTVGPVMDGQIIDSQERILHEQELERMGIARVDGQSIYTVGNEAWFREGKHGREVEVGDIVVHPVPSEKGEKNEMTYRMTAVINGESISHEITQKQYDKFMAVDDYHRMKLFSKIFDEVDMKTIPQERNGIHLGAGILAALTVAGELAHGMGHPHMHPDIYMERHGGGHVYFKPGVDTAQDIASRAFEAGINASEHGVGIGR